MGHQISGSVMELKENRGVEEKLQSTSVNQVTFTMVVNLIINFVHCSKQIAMEAGSFLWRQRV